MKKVLFLSALDFKEKSIQVIRKTPEAYANTGWQVDYIVARDNVANGNYYYEEEINPHGVNVYRTYWPFVKIRATKNRYMSLLLTKFSSFLVVCNLFLKARKCIKHHDYDVVYGYEMHGVLAMNLLKPFLTKKTKKVSRFQGTFLNEMFVNKQYLRLLFNIDLILAVRASSDLLIMTNDGTQGDKAVQRIKGNTRYQMVFWPNGVELLTEDIDPPFEKCSKEKVFVSISRLVGWKRVERNIKIIKSLKEIGFHDFKYYVIGEGNQKHNLESLVEKLGLKENVVFVGSVKHHNVIRYLVNADFFLTMYDSSNVGNPLLEAIRANKIIVTLSNGDTSEWISHKYNGLIYDPKSIKYDVIAEDIYELIKNDASKNKILENIKNTEVNKLWTWDQRLSEEIKLVGEL